METREAHYGKTVTQLTVGLSMLPSGCRLEKSERLNLGLLSLYIEASRHVFFSEFSIEFSIA